MFKDYYRILDIPFTSSKQEIKEAYRMMSLKWHPDRNPETDVTEMMQDINEAYKILNDDISRERYDKEYHEFNKQREDYLTKVQTTESNSWTYGYDIRDEELKNDINNARAYAKDLVNEFFNELKGSSNKAAKGAIIGLSYLFTGKY